MTKALRRFLFPALMMTAAVGCGSSQDPGGGRDGSLAELEGWTASFTVSIRKSADTPHVSAEFRREEEECAGALEGATLAVNGTAVEGEYGADPCSTFTYAAIVPTADDHRYEFQLDLGGERVTRTLLAEPVAIIAPQHGGELAANESFLVQWDRPLEDVEVTAARCVSTQYAETVTSQSATFPYLELVETPPCEAEISLRFSGVEEQGSPFAGGQLRYSVEQGVAVTVTR